MTDEQMTAEIRETNLTYLMLAQNLIRKDKAEAQFRLGISEESADLMAALSPAQLSRIASSSMLLCRFRFDDRMILGLLTDYNTKKPMGQSHAAVLMAGQPAAGAETVRVARVGHAARAASRAKAWRSGPETGLAGRARRDVRGGALRRAARRQRADPVPRSAACDAKRAG